MEFLLNNPLALVFLGKNNCARLRTGIIIHDIESKALRGDLKAVISLFERMEELGGVESSEKMRQAYYYACLYYGSKLVTLSQFDSLKALGRRISRMENFGGVQLMSEELIGLKEDIWMSIGDSALVLVEKTEGVDLMGEIFSYLKEEMNNLKVYFDEFEIAYDFQHSIRISDDEPRKRNPWSDLEVETLKEGVNKYCNIRCKWKNILDENKNIFVNRTTTDLKEKWRRIEGDRSKKESKQKGALGGDFSQTV